MMIESDEKRVVLSVIPSFHGYGVLVLLRNFICGETLISMKKFEEELFLSTIQRYKVSNLYFLTNRIHLVIIMVFLIL